MTLFGPLCCLPFQVYLTLAMCLALCAAGVWVNAALAWTSTLGIIAGLVCVPWLIATPARPDTKAKRQYLLAAAALSQGLMIGPLVNAALALAPGVVLTAAGATTAVSCGAPAYLPAFLPAHCGVGRGPGHLPAGRLHLCSGRLLLITEPGTAQPKAPCACGSRG